VNGDSYSLRIHGLPVTFAPPIPSKTPWVPHKCYTRLRGDSAVTVGPHVPKTVQASNLATIHHRYRHRQTIW